MHIATPDTQSSVDHSSTSTLSHSPSDAVISKDAGPSITNASNSAALVRSILEAYGKEILEFASDQFLDLAVAIRLKTISARELVFQLAEAERLGYCKTDIIDDEHQVACKGSSSRPDTIGTSKPPPTVYVQCHPVSTAPSQPSPLEELPAQERPSRGIAHNRRGKSLSMNEHLNPPEPCGVAAPEKEHSCGIQRIWEVESMRDRMPTAARADGRRGRGGCSRVGSGPRVAAHVSKSSNVLNRSRTRQMQDVRGGVRVQSRHPTRLAKASAAGQSLSTSLKRTELVIISDSDHEPEDDNDN